MLNKYRQTRTAHNVTRIEDWSTDSDIQPYNMEAEASNVPVGAIATGKEVDFSWMLLGIRQIHGHKKLLLTGIGTPLFWIQKNRKGEPLPFLAAPLFRYDRNLARYS